MGEEACEGVWEGRRGGVGGGEGKRTVLHEMRHQRCHKDGLAGLLKLSCVYCIQSAANGSALKGGAFWAWYDEGQVGPEGEGGGDGLFGIRDTSNTFDMVRRNAKGMAG